MKITKKTLAIGMMFFPTADMSVCPFKKDNDGYLIMSGNSFGTFEFGGDYNHKITITDTLRKYPTGHGYSGEMVRFEIGGHDCVMFWSDFKSKTKFYDRKAKIDNILIDL